MNNMNHKNFSSEFLREDNDRDGNNVNELKAMQYIKVISEELSRREAIIQKNKKRGREYEEGEEGDEDGVDNKISKNNREINSTINNVGTGAVNTVEFFKKQYNSFNSQLHRGGNNNSNNGNNEGKNNEEVDDDGVTLKKGVMHLNENRIWIKYHEG
ncbi:hypothetical protein C6P40_004843, partial [Pichia californica]